jgi:2-(1,2-epoxy-1,2-dihydrophenyl)acetyl-CoA isomerase
VVSDITGYLHVAIARLARMNKPLVTAVNGPAAGAGLSLAALGDIVLARRSSHFTLGYAGVGLVPDGGASWLLPRLIGMRRAQEMVLTNRRLSAEEAATCGLITRTVEDEDFLTETDRVVGSLAVAATGALGAARRLLLSSFSTTLETQMEFEARAITEAARTPNGIEGIGAFIEKRRPAFL